MKIRSILLIIGITAGVIWTGCDDNTTPNINIISITPHDGAVNVEKTTAIQVEFSSSMDPASCESRFGLHTGELTEMPTMDDMLGDFTGQFQWNTDHTIMTFQPDSMLMDSSMYTICLMEGMESSSHHNPMMMDGMMDFGNEVENGIFSKFSTK